MPGLKAFLKACCSFDSLNIFLSLDDLHFTARTVVAYRGQAFNQWLHACQGLMMLPSRSHSLPAHTLREKRSWQECHLFAKSAGVSGIKGRLRKHVGTFERLQ